MLRRRSSSISKIGSILPHTRTHRTRTHRSLTPSRTRRLRSAYHARRLGLLLLAPSHSHPCTSALIKLCCTTPSMATSARFTLVTFTASPCSCTRFSVTPRTRSVQLYSGAVLIRGVCKLKTRHGYTSANMFQVAPTPHASSHATWF